MLTKQCVQCSKTFQLTDEALAFYLQINVPAPTWCPACRLMRRMLWRNERALYPRTCDRCKKDVISIYSGDTVKTVYCRDCWYSDDWSPLDYGQDYDFSRSFFEQFAEVLQRMPMLNLSVTAVENSTYSNYSLYLKDCYLLFAGWECENTLYSQRVVRTHDTLDSLWLTQTQSMYESTYCINCYNVKYAFDCDTCSDSSFIMNCRGCTNCFGCVNLRNKQYYFFNKPYTKEEYEKLIQAVDLGSYQQLQNWQQKFTEHVKRFPRPALTGKDNTESSGDLLRNCYNCQNCFMSNTGENSAYCYLAENNFKNCHDIWTTMENNELCYELIAGGANNYGSKFCVTTYQGCANLQYCYTCISSRDSFGCVGLRNNQYCILNKQYTKEQYERLLPQIITAMTKAGEYGEFFPASISPFTYNETIAQQFFPLDHTKAGSAGYRWKEIDQKNIQGNIGVDDLPDHVAQINDTILQTTIVCAHEGKCAEQCSSIFKIIPEELQFYRQHNLALPRLCSNCRHYQRLRQCNPFQLWQKRCMCTQVDHGHAGQCATEFATSYAPDRIELIYCLGCYQKEVY